MLHAKMKRGHSQGHSEYPQRNHIQGEKGVAVVNMFFQATKVKGAVLTTGALQASRQVVASSLNICVGTDASNGAI